MPPAIATLVFIIVGALVTETAGYAWHRWLCHAGALHRLSADIFRRRHFDHHMSKYAAPAARRDTYSQSCDIAFQVLGVILVASMIVAAVFDWFRVPTAAGLASGVVGYGLVGSRLHALYHLTDRSAQKFWMLKARCVWVVFTWLRDFHDIHHVVNANYSLALPILDWIAGTYVSPKKLPELRTENLFPDFDPALRSSCDQSLFRARDSRRSAGGPD